MLQSKEQLHVAAQVVCDILDVDYSRVQLHIMATTFSNSKGAAIPWFEYDVLGDVVCRGTQIIINPILCGDDWLKVLCHELIHAHQLQTNRLSYEYDISKGYDICFMGPIPVLLPKSKPRVFWEREEYTHWVELMALTNNVGIYYSLPWEKEAFGFEEEILCSIPFLTEERIREVGIA